MLAKQEQNDCCLSGNEIADQARNDKNLASSVVFGWVLQLINERNVGREFLCDTFLSVQESINKVSLVDCFTSRNMPYVKFIYIKLAKKFFLVYYILHNFLWTI